MKKLTDKQKIFYFFVILFVATWAGGIIGFLAVLTLFFIAYLIDYKKKNKK